MPPPRSARASVSLPPSPPATRAPPPRAKTSRRSATDIAARKAGSITTATIACTGTWRAPRPAMRSRRSPSPRARAARHPVDREDTRTGRTPRAPCARRWRTTTKPPSAVRRERGDADGQTVRQGMHQYAEEDVKSVEAPHGKRRVRGVAPIGSSPRVVPRMPPAGRQPRDGESSSLTWSRARCDAVLRARVGSNDGGDG